VVDLCVQEGWFWQIAGGPTPLAADAASRPCIGARFGYVRHFELKHTSNKSRRG
jgi:hypothetical protein